MIPFTSRSNDKTILVDQIQRFGDSCSFSGTNVGRLSNKVFKKFFEGSKINKNKGTKDAVQEVSYGILYEIHKITNKKKKSINVMAILPLSNNSVIKEHFINLLTNKNNEEKDGDNKAKDTGSIEAANIVRVIKKDNMTMFYINPEGSLTPKENDLIGAVAFCEYAKDIGASIEGVCKKLDRYSLVKANNPKFTYYAYDDLKKDYQEILKKLTTEEQAKVRVPTSDEKKPPALKKKRSPRIPASQRDFNKKMMTEERGKREKKDILDKNPPASKTNKNSPDHSESQPKLPKDGAHRRTFGQSNVNKGYLPERANSVVKLPNVT